MKKVCQVCGKKLKDGDIGDAGMEYDLDICCQKCASLLEEGIRPTWRALAGAKAPQKSKLSAGSPRK